MSEFLKQSINFFTGLVDFPLTDLNMHDWVLNDKPEEPYFYDLIAVSNHFGGLGGGHYTAYARHPTSKEW